jgi:hypothetical protein
MLKNEYFSTNDQNTFDKNQKNNSKGNLTN